MYGLRSTDYNRTKGIGVTDSWLDPATLKAARLRAGLSQAALAAAIGVAGPMRISVWERGLAGPEPRMVPALMAALGVSAEALARGDTRQNTLRELRQMKGLTVTDAAARLGTSYSRYRDVELGHRPIRSAEIAGLAELLGVSEDRIRRAAGMPGEKPGQ